MSELSPTHIDVIVAACRAGAADAAEALGRALDGTFAIGDVAADSYDAASPPAGFTGPGLVMLLEIGGAGLAIVLPESSGALPAWYGAPDANGESKLSTLAQELSMLLAPETLAADKFYARRVPSITQAMAAGGAAADAALVTLDISAGGPAGALSLVWPLKSPSSVFAATTDKGTGTPEGAGSESKPAGREVAKSRAASVDRLPHYARSLLKIRIPVSIHLATKKESVQEVVELVPGAIIKFEKGCDQLLHMVVGGQTIAEGEAVKIGDKFGFRVTGMILPREHFLAVRPQKNGLSDPRAVKAR